MIQSNIQLEDIGGDSHEVHGLPEAQSTVSAVRANVPDVAGEVPETTDALDDNWNDGEPNEEPIEPDDDDENCIEIESERGEAAGDAVRMYLMEIGQFRLLKAPDEHVLARHIEGARHLTMLELELTEREGRPPRPWESTYALLSPIGDTAPLVAGLASQLKLPAGPGSASHMGRRRLRAPRPPCRRSTRSRRWVRPPAAAAA